jgi:hypothetical protein
MQNAKILRIAGLMASRCDIQKCQRTDEAKSNQILYANYGTCRKAVFLRRHFTEVKLHLSTDQTSPEITCE